MREENDAVRFMRAVRRKDRALRLTRKWLRAVTSEGEAAAADWFRRAASERLLRDWLRTVELALAPKAVK